MLLINWCKINDIEESTKGDLMRMYHVRCFKNLPNKMLQECTQCNARRLFILYCYTGLPSKVPYEYSLCIMQMHSFPIYII